MNTEPTTAVVAEHYAQQGLTERLLAALAEAGHDVDRLDPDALAGADEFHLGGRAATDALIASLDQPGMSRPMPLRADSASTAPDLGDLRLRRRGEPHR